jgi:DNA (cytosine-5)-methyltransferase 1
MSKIRAVSLYSGAGGLDLGFEAAGVKVSIALEADADSCKTWRKNFPGKIIEAPISEVSTEEILREGGLTCGTVDLLIGGPPCQPFSKSGYWFSGDSRRLHDPRAVTLAEYLRVLEESLPRAFLIENVDGLGYKGKNEGLEFIEEAIKRINKTCGTRYRPFRSVLNAADFGVPQIRRRLFVAGSREGHSFQFPEPTHRDLGDRDLLSENTPPYLTAWDALYDLPDDGLPEELTLSGRWAELLPSIPEGQNYLWHTKRGGGLPLFGWRRRYWSFLLKLAKSRPAWTIQAQPGPATGPFHWKNRRLSVREMCRLQTFPDGFEVVGVYRSAQRQVGNAVPPLLAEVIAREMCSQLLGHPLTNRGLNLALTPARIPLAPPEPVSPVPPKYARLKGEHIAHPGTGRGPRALERKVA